MIFVKWFEGNRGFEPQRMSFEHAQNLASINEMVLNVVNEEAGIYEILHEDTLKKRIDKQRFKEKKMKQKTVKEKEIQFNYNIAEHDLNLKRKKAIEFLDEGCRVTLKVINKNKRNISDFDVKELIESFAESIGKKITLTSFNQGVLK